MPGPKSVNFPPTHAPTARPQAGRLGSDMTRAEGNPHEAHLPKRAGHALPPLREEHR
ncbi:hypothetical protein SAM23877_7576 [Streptomyces ambofaciens ATCC 23877]|uniref:Uncharacterized protein n=1 Tax=Streptomyces ambofaciens (strain ATCC 23877 / 3486 / DSM 40053 / JCM 4204 / NBRC 12836 / NRRL B-2516) TaxID=278992 RepID=A0A0K2AJR6_STRA7|nr:hypothetical protein SAM23877_0097 [Streptomyces ambofaciens ATCC 23877]AKZ60617.1 hypothetical protein SAM23877_7576 [Streptomyces ambofaciens ATCC 23877]